MSEDHEQTLYKKQTLDRILRILFWRRGHEERRIRIRFARFYERTKGAEINYRAEKRLSQPKEGGGGEKERDETKDRRREVPEIDDQSDHLRNSPRITNEREKSSTSSRACTRLGQKRTFFSKRKKRDARYSFEKNVPRDGIPILEVSKKTRAAAGSKEKYKKEGLSEEKRGGRNIGWKIGDGWKRGRGGESMWVWVCVVGRPGHQSIDARRRPTCQRSPR